MQLALDTATWDIGLDGSGNIAVLVDPSALLAQRIHALLAQRIQCRLQTFKGECFLDRSVGVPYYEEILKKNPDLGRVRSLLASVIKGVDGVASILSLELTFSVRHRRLTVDFRVQGTAGEIAEGTI